MKPVIKLVIIDVTAIRTFIIKERIGSSVSVIVNYVTDIVDVKEEIKRDQSVLT